MMNSLQVVPSIPFRLTPSPSSLSYCSSASRFAVVPSASQGGNLRNFSQFEQFFGPYFGELFELALKTFKQIQIVTILAFGQLFGLFIKSI